MKQIRLTVAELNDALEAIATRRHGVEERRASLDEPGTLTDRRLEGQAKRLRALEARFSAALESDDMNDDLVENGTAPSIAIVGSVEVWHAAIGADDYTTPVIWGWGETEAQALSEAAIERERAGESRMPHVVRVRAEKAEGIIRSVLKVADVLTPHDLSMLKERGWL